MRAGVDVAIVRAVFGALVIVDVAHWLINDYVMNVEQ